MIKKYHLDILTSNLATTVILLFFLKRYLVQQQVFIYVILLICLGAAVALVLLGKRLKIPKKERMIERRFLLINLAISAAVSLMFVTDIGLLGVASTVMISALIISIEHLARSHAR